MEPHSPRKSFDERHAIYQQARKFFTDRGFVRFDILVTEITFGKTVSKIYSDLRFAEFDSDHNDFFVIWFDENDPGVPVDRGFGGVVVEPDTDRFEMIEEGDLLVVTQVTFSQITFKWAFFGYRR